MRVGTSLPLAFSKEAADRLLTRDAICEIAAAAERAGFDSIGAVEHPFPDDDWLATGGHHDLDPLVALSFAASATSTIGLRTSLLVLPYRNPFLAARSIASLDVLSGGRVVVGVGAGYLEAEFRALGVDFAERNELLDEGIVAMRKAWTEEGVHLSGRHFEARGHTMWPPPKQAGGPPIWGGGNSRRAIRRAVELCDGWMPMAYTPQSVSRRTGRLATFDDFRARLDYAAEHAAAVGRDRPLEVSFGLRAFPLPIDDDGGIDGLVAAAELMASLGVTETSLDVTAALRMSSTDPGAAGMQATSVAEHVAALERLGEEVVPRLHAVEVKGLLPVRR